jgi:hypothetical protein
LSALDAFLLVIFSKVNLFLRYIIQQVAPDTPDVPAFSQILLRQQSHLRTVIVTAGVHPRFGSRLAPLPLTFGHWPGISPYTSACAFAGTCVFVKQSLDVFRCGLACARQALFQSYGRCIAEFLNKGSLVHLGTLMPTHLCRFPVRILLV